MPGGVVWGIAGGVTLLALVATCWRAWRQLWPVWLCVGVLPLGVYGFLGTPDLPSTLAGAETPEAAARVRHLTAQLEREPGNVAVWAELATRHAAARRWNKAEAAFRGARVLAPQAPQLKAGLGELLVNRAGGMVPDEARELFRSVLQQQPDDLAALYYLGLAALQAQDEATARGYWQRLARIVPPEVPWHRDFMMNYAALLRRAGE